MLLLLVEKRWASAEQYTLGTGAWKCLMGKDYHEENTQFAGESWLPTNMVISGSAIGDLGGREGGSTT